LAYVLAADSTARKINLGSPDAIDLHNLASLIARKFNVSFETAEITSPETDWYVPEMKLARQLLGFAPVLSLRDAIDDLASVTNIN
jgi:nucleoside-diphosphate-sugar epimerase